MGDATRAACLGDGYAVLDGQAALALGQQLPRSLWWSLCLSDRAVGFHAGLVGMGRVRDEKRREERCQMHVQILKTNELLDQSSFSCVLFSLRVLLACVPPSSEVDA